ncbi:MAG: AAA family ATPase [Deltaproteobacteria bacterium]|nr:AAA family ATPase [Deltaproteobacteria bacterium]
MPTIPPQAAPLDNLRFVYVTGKGGVGKTTVSAALARAMAARGRRVLLCMCNAKERLSGMLGSQPIGPEIVHVAPNIDAVNMVPEKCLEEYGVLMLKSKTLYDALFDNRYVRTFFNAVPGMSEWSMLGKAWWHTTELLSGRTTDEREPPYGDGWKYETVIVDAPATGHGVDMLKVPRVLLDVAPGGPLRRDADRAWRLFQDPSHSGVILVTLPEEMPANETIELATAVRELGLPIPRLVVNALLPPLFTRDQRAQVAEQAKDDRLVPARARAAREIIQSQAMEKLSTLGIQTTYLPFLVTLEPSDPAAILYLAKGL